MHKKKMASQITGAKIDFLINGTGATGQPWDKEKTRLFSHKWIRDPTVKDATIQASTRIKHGWIPAESVRKGFLTMTQNPVAMKNRLINWIT